MMATPVMVNVFFLHSNKRFQVHYKPTAVDPCKDGSHQCEHVCHYTGAGSYTCSCNKGYKLEDNGHSCTGIIVNIICCV